MGRFPEGAVSFIKENALNDKIFNNYEWGGYITWMLYPQSRVFIDGRALVEEVYKDHARVMIADNTLIAGIPHWKAILDAYKVNICLIRGANFYNFRLHALVPALVKDNEWYLVYYDRFSILFLRNEPEFEAVIRKYSMPKDWAYNQVVQQAALGIVTKPWDPNVWITMAEAHLAKGMRGSAKKFYMKAIELKPDDKAMKDIVKRLESEGY